MSLPEIVSREEWLAARTALLQREKELTRARDALVADRRRLPMVEVTKDYKFAGPDGEVGLADLFEGRRQLILQHIMFGPNDEKACSGCTGGADEVNSGLLRHLAARDTTFCAVSRAAQPKLEAYREARGWPFAYYSSAGSEFNVDFGVTVGGSWGAGTYNYRPMPSEDPHQGEPDEAPGTSVFLRDGDRIFHTYSMHARGAEQVGGSYYFLDLTALGRQEDWEEPKGRTDAARGNNPDFSE
jgi:predicted dithiol-disulfide oxidoreductase (DUF899 family)